MGPRDTGPVDWPECGCQCLELEGQEDGGEGGNAELSEGVKIPLYFIFTTGIEEILKFGIQLTSNRG